MSVETSEDAAARGPDTGIAERPPVLRHGLEGHERGLSPDLALTCPTRPRPVHQGSARIEAIASASAQGARSGGTRV